MKELRITATVQMPEEMFAQAEKLAEIRPHIAAMEEALGIKATAEIVTPRKATKKAKPALHQAKVA